MESSSENGSNASKLRDLLPFIDKESELILSKGDFVEILIYLLSIEKTQQEIFKAITTIKDEYDIDKNIQNIIKAGKVSDKIFSRIINKLEDDDDEG